MKTARWVRNAAFCWILAAALLDGAAAFAAVMRTDRQVNVPAGETVEDDLYLSGGSVNFDGVVTGDLLVAAGAARIAGRVGGDLWVAGGDVVVSAEVAGSVRIAGGEVEVRGSIREDLLLASGEARLTPEAKVGRDVWAAVGEGRLAGGIARDLHVAGGETTVEANVTRDAQVMAEDLTVGSAAVIGGRLEYSSPNDAVIAPGARIAGGVQRVEGPQRHPGARAAWFFYAWLRMLIGLLALGLLFLLLAPGLTRSASATPLSAPGRSLLVGLIALLAIPFAALLILLFGALLGGWWIGLFVIALYLLALCLAFPLAAAAVGRWVLDRAGRPGAGLAASMALGVLILMIVAAVPVLGVLVVLVAVLAGFGALLLALQSERRRAPSAPAPAALPTVER